MKDDDENRPLTAEEALEAGRMTKDAITSLEDRLQIHRGFFLSLLGADDWSFVIKAHALLETSVNVLLEARFQNPDLADHFALLPLVGLNGKLNLLRRLDALPRECLTFAEKMSFLRNRMAHNVRNVDKTIADVVAKMKQDDVNSFNSAFQRFLQPRFFEECTQAGDYKTPIFTVLMMVLTMLSLKTEIAAVKADSANIKAGIGGHQ